MPSRKRKRDPLSNDRMLSKRDSFPFLQLPPELRNKIFQEVLNTGSDDIKQTLAFLLLTCRQMHAEIWPIFTSRYSFKFEQPASLANDFLSFLPRQHLYGIKHLTLNCRQCRHCYNYDKGFDQGCDTYLSDLECVWWSHLDVFARFDTITVEEYSLGSNWNAPRFYRVVASFLGMLEQGNKRTPQWVYRKKWDILRTSSGDMPNSHRWLMQIGSAIKTFGNPGWSLFSISRFAMVIRRDCDMTFEELHSEEHLNATFLDKWTLPPSFRQPGTDHEHVFARRLRPKYLQFRNSRQRSQLLKIYATQSYRWDIPFILKLGSDTQLLNDFSNKTRTVNGCIEDKAITIAGQWINLQPTA